jgi:hypothetical protein
VVEPVRNDERVSVDDMAFLLLLFTLSTKLGGKRTTPPSKQPPFLPEPGEDPLGTHPLPPNPLERR